MDHRELRGPPGYLARRRNPRLQPAHDAHSRDAQRRCDPDQCPLYAAVQPGAAAASGGSAAGHHAAAQRTADCRGSGQDVGHGQRHTSCAAIRRTLV